MCTLGDPLCDLGTLMSYWLDPDAGIPSTAMPTNVEGFLRSDEALRRYAERTGADLSAIPYYVVFGFFKTAVVLQQIYFRFQQGQTRDARFAGMEGAAKLLFEHAAARRP
jgi:aminoglycoside phosphotransferase (APT) family kinase protein